MEKDIAPLTGPEAFLAAVGDMYVHFLIVIGIAVAMAAFAVAADMLAVRKDAAGSAKSFLQRLRFDAVDYALYCGAFALFGLVTAYFLALGLNAANADEPNALASTFATPLIALLTGGVTFVAAKSKSQITSNALVLGILSFLIVCVLSYHTHTKQRFDYTAQRPKNAPTSQPTPIPLLTLPSPSPGASDPLAEPTLAPPNED
jgi:hypothetical protein